ncbi:MAG: hypothetical protein ACR5LA_10570 [Wolbachia sp.]
MVSVQDSGKSKSEFTTNGQCLTLASSKIYCKQNNIFNQKTGSQWALLHRSSEKNWQLLTKFIINSHLTVEEKICHKK